MPTYVYECSKCRAAVIKKKELKDFDTKEECSKCGHVMERKIKGLPSIVFKGHGFYSTDK